MRTLFLRITAIIPLATLMACSQQKIQQVPVISSTLSPTQVQIPPSPNVLNQPTSLQLPPIEYTVWLSQSNHQQLVNQYKQFLQLQHVDFIVPDHQMLRSARDWQQCNYTQYEVPPESVWETAVPTLKLFSRLRQQGLISNIEVTSSYRSPILNACAGGAKSSSHVKNSAIDFRIGSEHPSPQENNQIQKAKLALCQFWQQEGKTLNMGLGIYESGQIHIDTLGYRTWGYDHTWKTSLCGELI